MRSICYSLLFILLLFGFFCNTSQLVQKKSQEKSQKKSQDSFVIKKKKKKASKSKLQERVCYSFANQMASVPDLHKKLADVQKVLLEQTGKYLENSKDCILVKAKKEKVDAILQKSQEFEYKLREFCVECDEYVAYLHSLN